ncbi:MAG: glycosyltransferase family 2 protein [Actinobacteria bacterium]|nr:glycosyltransferase family 2 protein [Actinomycetota bacterium]
MESPSAAPATRATSRGTVSVVIPCLNEAETIAECVRGARAVLAREELAGEVIVVDNGSDDGSAGLAEAAGACVVHEPRRGYGSAYLAGLAAARGDYIIMTDADLTYDLDEIPRFMQAFEEGAEFVIGDRMKNIQPGAMPWLNRYVGNPLLSGFLNLLYRTEVSDAHCGLRGVRRDVLPRLDLRTTGMEFASEMVIRATKENLRIRQFPIELRHRGGESKLSPFRDGWRHLRLLLVYSPKFLFLLPGTIMILLGTLIAATVLSGVTIFGRPWYTHTLVGGSLLVTVGIQVIVLGLCARAYGVYVLGERDAWFDRMTARFNLEHGLVLGALVVLLGAVLGGIIVSQWIARGGGSLSEEHLAIVAATAVIAGIQIFFGSFLLSIIGLRRAGPQQGELG